MNRASNAVWFAVFDTALGPCTIAWDAIGIVGTQLPEGSAMQARERLHRRFPGMKEAVPDNEVLLVIDNIVALLNGEASDLSNVRLNMHAVPYFNRRVYEITRQISRGTTLTYGAVATLLGDPGAARAVGRALGENPFPIIIPCHRVVAARGKLGGFSAPGGVNTKLKLLAIEGGAGPLFA